MDPEITQPSLLARVRDSADQAAWRAFEAKYRELILRYARRRGLQSADCEDVRQCVMMNLSKSLRNFEYQPSKGRFRDYLGRVVRNAVHAQFARPKATTGALDSHVLATVSAPDEAESDDAWEQEWMNHHYRLALATVRESFEPRSLEVFDRLLNGESVATVAQDSGLSEPAVHKVKQRIRDRMKDLIAAQIREEDAPDGAG